MFTLVRGLKMFFNSITICRYNTSTSETNKFFTNTNKQRMGHH